jgi:small subunit ribosomal protein S16
MPVKIRLQRMGRKKAPFYHIIIADSRSPRDGKFIENIGSYNPTTIPATIELQSAKALDWLDKGAQPSDTVRRILSYKGVMFQKHLTRGVKKGVLTQEAADVKMSTWLESHKSATLDAAVKGKPARKKKSKKAEGAAPVTSGPVVEVAPASVVVEAPVAAAPVAEVAPVVVAEVAAPPVAETPTTEPPVAEA